MFRFIVTLLINGNEVSYVIDAEDHVDAQHQAMMIQKNQVSVLDCVVIEEDDE